MSGITIKDEVEKCCSEMKVQGSGSCEDDRIRIIIMTVCENNTMIGVKEILRQKDLKDEHVFDCLKKKLLGEDCCYFLYDCHYETQEGSKKEDMVFGCWCPSTTGIKNKMMYSSSKQTLLSRLHGCKFKVNLTEPCDLSNPDDFLEQMKVDLCSLKAFEGLNCVKGHVQSHRQGQGHDHDHDHDHGHSHSQTKRY